MLASLAFSLAFWWGLSRICVPLGKFRYIPIGLVSATMASMVCAGWQYQRIVGGELTLGPAIYLFEESDNALDLLSAGLSWQGLAGVALLIAVWTWALTIWQGPSSVLTRRLSIAAVVMFVLSGMLVTSEIRINELPDLSDSVMARLLSNTILVIVEPTEAHLPTLPRQAVAPQTPVQGPNVLIIVNESLRRDSMQVFGYPHSNTPRMDAFFAQNTAQIYDFTHAFTTAANTMLSWTSLLTGRYLLQPRETLGTVPLPWHYARAVGHATFFVSPQNWGWRGMNDFFMTFDPPDYKMDASAFDSPIVNDMGIDDLVATQVVIDRLEEYAKNDRSFLGILQTNATHFPFLHDEDRLGPATSSRDRYNSAIGVLDRVFGRVIDGLRETDLLDDTIIIYTADHAEFIYGEPGAPPLDIGRRALSCHPFVIRIPFFIYVPAKWEAHINVENLRANTSRMVSNVDIMPTLLDLWGIAGIDSVEGALPMDGQSLMTPVSEERSVWCFNQPVWSTLPNAAFGVYSHERLAYIHSQSNEILYMNSSDWMGESQWHHWDSPTAADRAWLSQTLAEHERLEPYMLKIQAANPSLMQGLSP